MRGVVYSYSAPVNGINDGGARLGRRDFEKDWLPVFGAAIKEGALGIMTSYNAIDGECVSGSRWLLTDVLRTEFGFEVCLLESHVSRARSAARNALVRVSVLHTPGTRIVTRPCLTP